MREILILIFAFGVSLQIVSATTMKIYPSDDAFVRDTESSTNYGSNIDLRTGYERSFGIDRSYLKFALPSLNGTTQSAKLSLEPNANQNSPIVKVYYVPSDSWSEDTITWNSKPAYSNLIATSNTINNNNRIELNILNSINESDSVLSVVLIEDNEDGFVQFFSKEYYFNGSEEDKDRWPYIEVEYSDGECNTQADTNCDGCVSLIEIVGLMSLYKSGQTNLSLIEMVNLMSKYKSGEIAC